MADIKQAAQWTLEGHSVTRAEIFGWYSTDSRDSWCFSSRKGTDYERRLTAEDILADDREIAE